MAMMIMMTVIDGWQGASLLHRYIPPTNPNEDEDLHQSWWLCGFCRNNHQRRYNHAKGMIEQDIDPTLRKFKTTTK